VAKDWAMTDEAINRTIYVLVAISIMLTIAERYIKACGRVQRAGCTCDQRKNDAD
jgi:hypothetical protein